MEHCLPLSSPLESGKIEDLSTGPVTGHIGIPRLYYHAALASDALWAKCDLARVPGLAALSGQLHDCRA